MSLFSMKMKMRSGSVVGDSLISLALKVVAINDHPDQREMSVHLRLEGETLTDRGTVDLVLREEDRDAALALMESGVLAVDQPFTLQLS